MLGKQFVVKKQSKKTFILKNELKSLMYKTKLTCSSCVFKNMQCKLFRFNVKVKLTKNNETYQ